MIVILQVEVLSIWNLESCKLSEFIPLKFWTKKNCDGKVYVRRYKVVETVRA